MFADRASAARGGAELLADSLVAVIGRICRELDGLPLAIELAAARASVLSVEEIEAHLADKFRFLAYRRPAGDPRHQGLRAAIDWSYQLLPAAEQRALGAVVGVRRRLRPGPGRWGVLRQRPGRRAWTWWMGWSANPFSSLRPPVPGPGTGCWKPSASTPPPASPTRVRPGRPGGGMPRRSWTWPSGNQTSRCCPVSRTTSAPRSAGRCPKTLTPGRGWPARSAGSGRSAGSPWRDKPGWNARSPRTRPTRGCAPNCSGCSAHELCYFGDLDRADTVLSEGSQVAAAAGLQAVQARIRVLLHLVQSQLGQPDAEALTDCQAAAATLESEGDLAGLAEALVTIGIWRGGILGDTLAGVEDLERAIALARASGNHRAELDAIAYLLATYLVGPIPLDTAISRAEQFLDQASADPWAKAELLQVLAGLYAQAGRLADARAAISRAQSAHARAGAKINAAVAFEIAGLIEMIAGDPAAAEQQLTQSCELLRPAEHSWSLPSVLPSLAEAVYAQGRLDEAEQLTEEAQALADAGDFDTQARWRATRAKILARRGQHAAAKRLADQAEAFAAPDLLDRVQAQVLEAKAEVSQLAGAAAEAETCLRAALILHEQRRASALADRTRAALASLTGHPR